MEEIEERFRKIEEALTNEGIKIYCTISPEGRPLIVMLNGKIILGHTKDILDEDGNINHYWEKIYPSTSLIMYRYIPGYKDRKYIK